MHTVIFNKNNNIVTHAVWQKLDNLKITFFLGRPLPRPLESEAAGA